VQRIEGKIVSYDKHENGDVRSVTLASGQVIEGDLFIDCTGFRALLIGDAMQEEVEDWSQWLFCDRAIAVQTSSVGDAVPLTRSMAHQAGWQWRIRCSTGSATASCIRAATWTTTPRASSCWPMSKARP
jgi:tryptophan halogenase